MGAFVTICGSSFEATTPRTMPMAPDRGQEQRLEEELEEEVFVGCDYGLSDPDLLHPLCYRDEHHAPGDNAMRKSQLVTSSAKRSGVSRVAGRASWGWGRRIIRWHGPAIRVG